ncbi:hypothetical protein ABI428_36480, partial [Pseudomonas aeruginosa]
GVDLTLLRVHLESIRASLDEGILGRPVSYDQRCTDSVLGAYEVKHNMSCAATGTRRQLFLHVKRFGQLFRYECQT